MEDMFNNGGKLAGQLFGRAGISPANPPCPELDSLVGIIIFAPCSFETRESG